MEPKELSIGDLIQNYCLSSIQCDRCSDDDEQKEEIYKFNMKLQTEISSRLKCGEENEIIIRDLKADNKAWCDCRVELLESMAELDLKYINACKLIVDLENEVLKMKKMRKCTAQRQKVIEWIF